jgi:predicted ATPase
LPRAVEALVKTGPDLIDLLVPGALLLERAETVRPWPLDPALLDQLETLVARKAAAPSIPALQQSALFEEYTQVMRTLAAQKPLLLTVDDLQWADSGSIHLLFHLGRRLAGSRILLVGAYRPAEIALGRPASLPIEATVARKLDAARERHPLEPIANELKRTFGDIAVDLERSDDRPFVDALLDSEPNRLAHSFRDALHRRTQGHPLFTVELLRGMQERGDLVQDGEGRWVQGPALDWETLPARVEAVIAERIGRLPHSLRQLLSVASVEGETFTAEVVARLQGTSERKTVRRLSETLDRQHRVVSARGIRRLGGQRLSRYRFRHILFQKYLYSALDPVERVYLHEQVGTALEELHGDEEIPAVALELARHFQEAEITDKAIGYLHQAGKRAVQLSAYEEGIVHLTRGLALLAGLPDSPTRDEQELALQLALGAAQIGHGSFYREVGTVYARARELGQQMGKTEQLCQALGELAIFHYVRAEHRTARALAEEALDQARRTEDPLLVAWCQWHLGFILFGLGEYTLARDHLEQVLTFYIPEKHHHALVRLPGADAGVSAMAYQACCLWCLGYPEQAAKQSQKALTLARELGHPLSLADVLCYGGCLLNAMRRDAPALKQCAEELMQSAMDQVPAWLEPATLYRGQAVAMLGQVQEGMAQMREGIAASQSRGVRCYVSGVLCSLAEVQAKTGRPDEGLTTLAEALAFVEQTDDRHWEAELHRIRAELLLMQGREAEAEASLHRAIEVARRQQAKSWELRATTSLARLWQAQGKAEEARQMLADVYAWFTEGFDTPDLREAKTLLEELA